MNLAGDGRVAGTEFYEVEHVGMVLSGRATAAIKDGEVVELTPGTLFYVPPTPHDRLGYWSKGQSD